jgi:hypothetical protein
VPREGRLENKGQKVNPFRSIPFASLVGRVDACADVKDLTGDVNRSDMLAEFARTGFKYPHNGMSIVP